MKNKKQYKEWFSFKTVYGQDVTVYTNGKLRWTGKLFKWKMDGRDVYLKHGRFGVWEKKSIYGLHSGFTTEFLKAIDTVIEQEILS